MKVHGRLTLWELVVIGLIATLFLVMTLAPHVEFARSDVQRIEAYQEALELKANAAGPLTQNDPWGEPYRAVRVSSGALRIVSTGPDRQLDPGVRGDDIYAGMPVPPREAIASQKNRQWMVFLAAAIAVWSGLGVWGWRFGGDTVPKNRS